jgi:peptidoglycan hydrolase-like protein with peptidoglycan-binding domain
MHWLEESRAETTLWPRFGTALDDTFTLGASVGKGGKNRPEDVRALKKRLIELGFDWLDPDTEVDKATIAAIQLFQSIMRGKQTVSGDGLVSVPGKAGTTLAWLREANAPRWQLMPEGSEAEGFLNYERTDTKDQYDYGTNWMADAIRGAGAKYRDDYLKSHASAPLLSINDVSLPHGGSNPDHGGHETGMACDARLPRNDGKGAGSITWKDKIYDRDATRAQIKAVRAQPNVSFVFFNDPVLIGEKLCSKLDGHDNHFHFQLRPPALASSSALLLEEEWATPFDEPKAPRRSSLTWSFNVVDESDRPLEGERYILHQDTQTEDGTLGKGGRASLSKIDPEKPFLFEVAGRVCGIKEGVVLMTEAPGTEYGGTFFDWSTADDDAKADKEFWPEYERRRKSALASREGPATFWQHEHLTRRLVQLRKKYRDPAAGRVPVFQAIPVQIRTGPTVRFTRNDCAVIWVETETPALLRVTVKPRSATAAGTPIVRHGATVRAGGRNFAAVLIPGLAEDTSYLYTLELAPLPAKRKIPDEEPELKSAFPQLSRAVQESARKQLRAASFDGNEWLGFRTLRRRYDADLRFAYGSCRKWPNDRSGQEDIGADTMLELGKWLAAHDREKQWPQFLFFIGDQIYADDIGTRQGLAIGKQRWGSRIPGRGDTINGAWAGRFAERFTAVGQPKLNRKYRIDNHALWEIPIEKKDTPKGLLHNKPAGDSSIPAHPDVPPLGQATKIHAADFAEFSYMYEAAWTSDMPVRRVLANVPVFMIFDDHEVTDDLNFDFNWADIVYNSDDSAMPYWTDTIADGLAAYWFYQGWGNLAPEEWKRDPRAKLVQQHLENATDALPQLRALLRASLPSAKRMQTKREVASDSPLNWDFKLPIVSPVFCVLDTRTKRGLLPSKGPAFDDHLMQPPDLSWLQTQLESTDAETAFVVATTPMLLPGTLPVAMTVKRVKIPVLKDIVVTESLRRERDMDTWPANASWGDLLGLLVNLSKSSKTLKTVVALSGDVHFNYNMMGALRKADIEKQPGVKGGREDGRGFLFPYLLQLVSSPIRNQLDAERVKKLQMFVEDDSVVAGLKKFIPDSLQLIRKLLFKSSMTRGTFDFDGMKLRVGGFRNTKDPRRTVLPDNAVALVHVNLAKDASGKSFELAENYLTGAATPPSFAYRLTSSGAKMTTPDFDAAKK